MEEKILKSIIYITLLFTLSMCKNKDGKSNVKSKEVVKIEKAINLIKKTKEINDTLTKYHNQLGVNFIPCYIRETKKHRFISFQIVQSKKEKLPPIKIDREYKIEKIRGIDVFLSTNILDTQKKYKPSLDEKTKELIKKGYLTIDGNIYLNDGYTVYFVFCKDNNANFKILTTNFIATEELKARSQNKPFFEEKFYPICK